MSTSNDWRKAWRDKARQNTSRRRRTATAAPVQTRTITVAKPFCAPARPTVVTTFEKYGVKLYGYSERVRLMNPLAKVTTVGEEPQHLPLAQVAKVTVSAAAAGWAEYLLLRTGDLHVLGNYVNRRNETWAAKHGGVMPTAWMDKQNPAPWLEPDCKAGHALWQAAHKAKQRRRR